MKGAVRVQFSPELIIRELHIPDDVKIVDAKIVGSHLYPSIEFVFTGDGLPEVEYGEEPMLVYPVIHYEPQNAYRWDWNIVDDAKIVKAET